MWRCIGKLEGRNTRGETVIDITIGNIDGVIINHFHDFVSCNTNTFIFPIGKVSARPIENCPRVGFSVCRGT